MDNFGERGISKTWVAFHAQRARLTSRCLPLDLYTRGMFHMSGLCVLVLVYGMFQNVRPANCGSSMIPASALPSTSKRRLKLAESPAVELESPIKEAGLGLTEVGLGQESVP